MESFLKRMNKIQDMLLQYLEDEESDVDAVNTLFEELDKYDYEFKIILHLIEKISNNHHRSLNFFDKIEQILIYYKDKMKQNFSNLEIFNIFKKNCRIIFFLIDQKFIIIDRSIYNIISKDYHMKKDYLLYFIPEIQSFLSKMPIEDSDELLSFNEKRKLGENDSYICNLIRNDSVEEFVAYVNRSNIRLSATIPNSIFETNSFLIKQKEITLIEYATFFGSIQIFQYLRMNKVELTPSLWLYAIHSNNPMMIHLLEDYGVEPQNKTYNNCLMMSIKCFHNQIADYIKENHLKPPEKNIKNIILGFMINVFSYFNQFPLNKECLFYKYFNFQYIPNDTNKIYEIIYMCYFDYHPIVENLILQSDFDINKIYIFNLSL